MYSDNDTYITNIALFLVNLVKNNVPGNENKKHLVYDSTNKTNFLIYSPRSMVVENDGNGKTWRTISGA